MRAYHLRETKDQGLTPRVPVDLDEGPEPFSWGGPYSGRRLGFRIEGTIVPEPAVCPWVVMAIVALALKHAQNTR